MTNKKVEEKAMTVPDKRPPTKVNAQVIVPQVFNDNLSLSGSIEANEQIEIRSEVSGIVESIQFQEGQTVSKGQLLFKVNDAELKAQLLQIQTKETLALENERRANLLLAKSAISQEEYDMAKAELKSVEAQIQLVNTQIARTAIRAPFSGRIGLRNISPGTYITPTVLVGKLVNTDKLKITFSVPEKYAAHISINANIQFNVAGTPENFTAKIYATEPGIDVNTRTLQVRAITDNKGKKLLPGSFADIIFPLNALKGAIAVPSEAVVPVQGGKKVYLAQNGIAKEQTVETSIRTDSSVLVISGLKAGDTLITSGVMSLKNGVPVKLNIGQ